MKYLMLFCFLIGKATFAQTNSDSLHHHHIQGASMGFYALATGIESKTCWGGGFEFEVYLKKRFATGLNINGCGEKKIPEHFNYIIGRPLIGYFEFGWQNHYDLFETYRFLFNLNLNTGLAGISLSDDSIKVTVNTRYGPKQEAKTIATNHYYFAEPGADLLIKLGHYNHHTGGIYLSSKIKYHFYAGGSKFGTAGQFSNFTFGIGILVLRKDSGVYQKKL